MRISIPLVMDGPAIVYPGDFALWSNTAIVSDRLVGDYHGEPSFPYLPADLQPELVITAITVDEAHAAASTVAPGFAEVDLPKGATLTATAELRLGGQVLSEFDEAFRLPIQASDGRERIARAQFVAGVATVAIPFPENGVWFIREDEVNKRLPPERHMAFSGITVYAVG